MDRQCDPERNVTDNRNGQKMLPGIACVRMSECVSLCVLLSPTHSCALTAARACVSPSGRMEARASLRPLQQRNDTHDKQRTDERRDHIVLGVPFIALPTSHCTPFPGATISATILSMISKQSLTARMIATGNAKLQTPRPNSANRKSNSRIGKPVEIQTH